VGKLEHDEDWLMIKKLCYKLSYSLAAFSVALAANADVMLKDQSEIIGAWNVTAEAAKLDGDKKLLNVQWDFRTDGVLQTKAIDTGGRTKSFEIPLKYSVEGGMIKKQSTPGREKYESCKVIEKEGSDMIIKCTYLYFFLSKI
jgi:hypothetical protein